MQVYRAFSLTWPTCAQFYCNKRKLLHNKRVHLPQDWIGTPTWPPWRHLKTLYPPLWGCEGDRFEMVVKVYCGTVLRTKLPPCWKCVPQNSPTMHLTSIPDPVSRTTSKWPIGHFRVPPGLCIKTRLSAQPLIWKWFFILMQIKLIFIRKVVYLASFWKWGLLELGSGLLSWIFLLGVPTPN